jgi:hypothetical protein
MASESDHYTYLFSKKVEKTALFRDNLFIVCGLRDRVILRNAHAHLEMCASKQCRDWSEPWCELWAPIGYQILITTKIFPSYLTPRSATSKSSATSQCALKFFGSERHVKKDSKFFSH